MNVSRSGKNIGIFSEDDLTGRFFESWKMEMAAFNFEIINIGASIAYIMAIKDGPELAIIRDACLVSGELFRSYLKPHILKIINDVHVS